MENIFKVYNEDYKKVTICKSLKEAEAVRYAKYGYAGYIIEFNNNKEIKNHS